jgi:hypothetical protein
MPIDDRNNTNLRSARENLKRTLSRGIAGTSGTTADILLAEIEHLIDAMIDAKR